jgi:hypothetical protein
MEAPPVLETNRTSGPSVLDRLSSVFHSVVVAFGFLLSVAAYALGLLFNWLFVVLVLLACGVIISRIIGLSRSRLLFGLIRRPFAPANRKYLFQALNVWLFVALAAWAVRMAVIPAQFSADEFRAVQLWIWGCSAFLVCAVLAPQKRVLISTNLFFAVGWLFLVMELFRALVAAPPSNSIVLSPPFRGEWYVYHGGRSALFNHHYAVRAQRDALDLAMTVNGREVHDANRALDSYAAFGQTLYAPIDGKIVRIANDRPDMPIGQTDQEQIVGNHIVIDAGKGRFVLHLKRGSVRVSVGDSVKIGDPIAQCGNSGNTSAPHLHLQVQDGPDILAPNVRTFPILFREVTRVRAGRTEHPLVIDLRRNDRLLIP